MKKKVFVVLLFVVVAAGSYTAGYVQAEQRQASVTLGRALEDAAYCALSLDTLGENRQDKAVRLLDMRLRNALRAAEAHSHAIDGIDTAVPSLIDGLRRAKMYADRIGDARLSQRLATLHQRLVARG